MAIKHSGPYAGPGAGGYWAPTPEPLPPTALPYIYETQLWDNVWQSNGYLYLLKLISTNFKLPGWMPWERLIFGVGIEAQGASPAWYWTPPAHPVFPSIGSPSFFGATQHDYDAELALSSNPAYTAQPNGTNFPVNAITWPCVTIVDQDKNPIDFFPLMDEHDPSGLPW
jgi:hypothetical protein